MRSLNFSLLLMLFSQTALAQLAEKCTTLQQPTERLACYDAAYQHQETQDPPQSANWQVHTTKSVFTDELNAVIASHAEKAVTCGNRQVPLLVIRCQEGATAMFVTHGCFAPTPTGRYGLDFEYRIDQNPTKEWSATTTSDDTAFGFLVDAGARTRIMHMLIGHEKIAFRFTPYRAPTQTIVFNITGLSETMTATKSSCDWSDFVVSDQ